MSDDQVFMLTDEDGGPLGMVSLSEVNARADRLAFALAAVCDEPRRIAQLITAARAAGGTREFEYVAAAALGTVIEDIVRPLVVAAEGAGYPLRECLARVAETSAPPCLVCGHRSHALFEVFGFEVKCVSTRGDDERDDAPGEMTGDG